MVSSSSDPTGTPIEVMSTSNCRAIRSPLLICKEGVTVSDRSQGQRGELELLTLYELSMSGSLHGGNITWVSNSILIIDQGDSSVCAHLMSPFHPTVVLGFC